jgi:hypothetical protein
MARISVYMTKLSYAHVDADKSGDSMSSPNRSSEPRA